SVHSLYTPRTLCVPFLQSGVSPILDILVVFGHFGRFQTFWSFSDISRQFMPISPYPDILDRSYFLLLHLWIVITNNIMAKQESLVKIRGTIGDLSFSKHRERGYEVRAKGGVDKARIMSDPNFERTRENMSEFASAAQMAKVIRLQLNNLSRDVADKSFRNRL